MKVEIRTNVDGGKFKRNLPLILDAIREFEGKEIILSIQRAGKKRSNPQNAYYWGVIILLSSKIISESWGEVWTSERTHEFFKAHFLFDEKYNDETGQIVKIPKSTTENTTTQQEEYHENIRQFIFEWFNINLPLPNDEILLEL